jgi:hypothetical protein
VADVLALEKVVDAGMEVALQPIQIKIDDFWVFLGKLFFNEVHFNQLNKVNLIFFGCVLLFLSMIVNYVYTWGKKKIWESIMQPGNINFSFSLQRTGMFPSLLIYTENRFYFR